MLRGVGRAGAAWGAAKGCQEDRGSVGGQLRGVRAGGAGGAQRWGFHECGLMWVKGAVAKSSWLVESPLRSKHTSLGSNWTSLNSVPWLRGDSARDSTSWVCLGTVKWDMVALERSTQESQSPGFQLCSHKFLSPAPGASGVHQHGCNNHTPCPVTEKAVFMWLFTKRAEIWGTGEGGHSRLY